MKISSYTMCLCVSVIERKRERERQKCRHFDDWGVVMHLIHVVVMVFTATSNMILGLI